MATSFEYQGKHYELKMTRAGAAEAEAQGLMVTQMADKPLTSIRLLFFGALYSQFRVNPAKAASMLDDLLDSGELDFQSLFEELAEAYTELFNLGESKDE